MKTQAQKRIIMSILLIGLIAVLLVALSAYAAELKYDNNVIASQNEDIQGQIDTIGVQIKAANSVDQIMSTATEKLGMVYARDNQCVYLEEESVPDGSLAMIIRENIYN